MPSLFGALDTSVSGLTAQSAAFGNISDNVANSQTTGFKGIDTSFTDYLTNSTATVNDSGFVNATPNYENNVQGTISASTNALALAISGNGFFDVSQAISDGTGNVTLGTQSLYTRNGNFQLNSNGYLVNDVGEALNGWSVNTTTGIVDQSQVVPIKVNTTSFSPVPTTSVTLQANLPATPSSTTPVSSQVNIYDATGTEHVVNLAWSQTATNTWTVAISAPDATTPALGGAQVTFGPTSGNTVPAGTVGSLTNSTGTVTSTSYSSGGTAALNFTADFGNGPQTVALQLGTFGQSNGLTQYAGTAYSLSGLTQNGVPPGAFNSVSLAANGNVVANYDNGQSRVVAKIPLVQFAAPDGLQRQNGQSFTATNRSGAALVETVGTNGTGTLVTNSLEGSNVDIATEFTKLIVAQQAYSANAKMVTTADDMLTATINIKR